MQPSLDEIQLALNKATQFVLEVSRGVAQWGQDRIIPIITDDTQRSAAGKEINGKWVLLFFLLLKVSKLRTSS